MRATSSLIAWLAAVRCVSTVVSAVMTWLTIWHFISTPFPLFYGWLYHLVALTVCSSIVVCRLQDTGQLLQQIWQCPCGQQTADNSKQGKAADNPANVPFNQQITQQQGPIKHVLRSIWSCVGCCSCCLRRVATSLVAAIVATLLLAAFLLLHGGAVLADIRLLIAWRKARQAVATSAQQACQQQLQEARHVASQSSVLLALLFVVPSVSVKWALMIINLDFSTIPVTSATISTVSSVVVVSTYLSSTYIYCPIWTRWQRISGVGLVTTTVLGMFLWRLAAFCFLVFKFGGEVEPIWVWLCHLVLCISVFARSQAGRRAFLECYLQDRVMVVFLTVTGAAVLSFDIPSMYQGLKSQQLANKPAWLQRTLLNRGSIALLSVRVLEGIVGYILVITLHPIPACVRDPIHVSSLYDICATVAQRQFWWRPRCWGCSNYDLFANSYGQAGVWLPGLMLGSAGLLLLLTVLGLGGTWLLGRRYASVQLHCVQNASTTSAIPAAISYTSSSTGVSALPRLVRPSVDAASSVVVALPTGSQPLVDPGVLGSRSSNPSGAADQAVTPMMVTTSTPSHLAVEQQWQQQQSIHNTAIGWMQTYPAVTYSRHDTHATIQAARCSVASFGTSANNLQVSQQPSTTSNLTPWSSVGPGSSNHQYEGFWLVLEVTAVLIAVLLADVIVFNFRWYIQAALLPGAVAYVVWMHLGYVCCGRRIRLSASVLGPSVSYAGPAGLQRSAALTGPAGAASKCVSADTTVTIV